LGGNHEEPGVKGFGRKNGRATKGGSLLGKRGAGDRSKRSEPSTQKKENRYNRDTIPKGNSKHIADLPLVNDAKAATPYFQSILDKLILRLITATPSRPQTGSSKNGRYEDKETIGRYQDNRKFDSGIGLSRGSSADSSTIRTELISAPLWKRILDVTCILLALPFWLPLILLVMCFIRLTSSGPIFYRQARIGYRRSQFMLFKFRTMHVNADTRTHEDYFVSLMRSDSPMIKLDSAGDSRLIPWGSFLRASGLDELPQVFNVLRGEMSLVGPRPCTPHEFERYEPWEQQRVNVPPGLTGYWQVNGKNRTTFREMITMDIFYMRNMSIWLDLSVILRTVPVLVRETLAAWNRFRSRRASRATALQPDQAVAATERMGGGVKRV
jgi:lipopolysaccharide/colanic/teichoic acid biosynthesis glycosyltransferase